MMVFLGGTVGGLLIAMYLPIFKIAEHDRLSRSDRTSARWRGAAPRARRSRAPGAGPRSDWRRASRSRSAALAVAVALDRRRPPGRPAPPRRAALLARSRGASCDGRVRRRRCRCVRGLRRFAALQLAIDVALVTALVHFSGGARLVLRASCTSRSRCTRAHAVRAPRARYGAARARVRGLRPGAAGRGAHAARARSSARPLPGTPLLGALGACTRRALLLVALLASALARELRSHRRARSQRSASDLRELRDLHERTVESLTSGLLTTDLAGRITSFNPGGRAHHRAAPRGEVLGRDVDEVLPGAREIVLAPRGASRGAPRARMRLLRPARRSELPPRASARRRCAPPRAAPGGYVVIFQDVTDVVRDGGASCAAPSGSPAIGQLSAEHRPRDPQSARGDLGLDPDARRPRTRPRTRPTSAQRLMEIVLRETERLDRADHRLPRTTRGPRAARARARSRSRALVEDVREMFEASRPAGRARSSRRARPDLRGARRPAPAPPGALEPGAQRGAGDARGRRAPRSRRAAQRAASRAAGAAAET